MTSGLREAAEIELIGGGSGFPRALQKRLAEAGVQSQIRNAVSGKARAVILLGDVDPSDSLGFHANAIAAARSLAPHYAETGGLLVTVQDTGGRFAPTGPAAWLGGLSSIAKTAAKEWPSATIRAIDLAITEFGPDRAAAELVDELMTGGDAPMVGLSPSGRVIQTGVAWSPTPTSPSGDLHAEDVFIVTGGGRGVTADCVVALAARTQARFALMGRTPLVDWPADITPGLDEFALRGALARQAGVGAKPKEIAKRAKAIAASDEVRRTLAALEAHGAPGIYITADAADAGSVAKTVEQTERAFGQVTGLVHGAGLLADKRLADKTPDQVARVFAPKVAGLKTLLDALDPDRLKRIALFSSAAARYGNIGQADYAAANEVLNRVAWSLKQANPACGTVSINWGPWDGGMVDDTLRASFKAAGIDLIDRQAGADVFADLMALGSDCPVEVCVGSAMPDG